MQTVRQLLAHNRDFRFLWYGQIVSQLGDWFNLLCQSGNTTAINDFLCFTNPRSGGTELMSDHTR